MSILDAPPSGAAALASPYLGLAHYSEESAEYFFGREEERKVLIANLRASRLTLLYAQSGTGKSSLLRAGVAARLRELGRRSLEQRGTARNIPVVFSAWLDEPADKLIDEIEAAVAPFVDGGAVALPRASIGEALAAASAAADATLLVILDQFEEYFLYQSREARRGRFADELAAAISRADLRANFLIAIREDAYAGLGDLFNGRIDNVYGNYLHLENLTRRAAREAIEGPIERFNELHGTQVEIEPALIDAVLAQLSRPEQFATDQTGKGTLDGASATAAAGDHIAAPYLQLVMKRLWDSELEAHAPEDAQPLRLRRDTLDELGGASTIVRTHVDRALGDLAPEDRDAAADVFHHLVTRSGTKIALAAADLADYTSYSVEELQELLERLTRGDVRILHDVPPPPGMDGTRFEISHDLLAAAILDWRTRQRAARLERERNEAEHRARAERRRAQRFRRISRLALGLFVLVLAALVIVLWRTSVSDQQTSQSRRLAAAADVNVDRDPELSALLALQALHVADTSQAEAALREALPLVQTVRRLQSGSVVLGATFDPKDPNIVASAEKNGSVMLWNVKSGRAIRRLWPKGGFKVHGTANTVAFNPTGTELAAGYAGTIAVFDLSSGRQLRLGTDGPVVNDILFDGNDLVFATAHGIGYWTWDRATCCGWLARSGDYSTIAHDPDGKAIFVSSGDGVPVIWNLTGSKTQKHTVGTFDSSDAQWSQNGNEIVTADGDGTVRVYTAGSSPTLIETLDAAQGFPLAAVFSPDGNKIAAGYSDGTVRVWDLATGLQLTRLLGHSAQVTAVGFDSSGNEVVSASLDGTIRVWHTLPEQLQEQFASSTYTDSAGQTLQNPAYMARYDATGGRLLIVDDSGNARLFSASGTPIRYDGHAVVFDPGSGVTVNSAGFSPNGTEVVTADSNGSVDLWHANGTPLVLRTPIKLGAAAQDAAFSPGGAQIVAVSGETAQVFSARTGMRVLPTLSPHSVFDVASAEYSPNRNRHQILTADDNGQVELWNALTGHELKVFGAVGAALDDVEFNSAGNEFVTASTTGAVSVWSEHDSQPLLSINACPSPNAAAFSPTVSEIAVACGDGTIPIYDSATGQLLTVLSAASAPTFNTVQFSPTGKRLVATYGLDGSGGVWVWSTGLATPSLAKLERLAGQRITRKLTPAERKAYLTGISG